MVIHKICVANSVVKTTFAASLVFTTIAITATTVIQTVLKDGLVIKTTFVARSVIKK